MASPFDKTPIVIAYVAHIQTKGLILIAIATDSLLIIIICFIKRKRYAFSTHPLSLHYMRCLNSDNFVETFDKQHKTEFSHNVYICSLSTCACVIGGDAQASNTDP